MGSQWSNKSNTELDNRPSELRNELNQFKPITKPSECQEAVHEMDDQLIADKYTVERSNEKLTDACCTMKNDNCVCVKETIDELKCSLACSKNNENYTRNNLFACTEQLACMNAEIKVNCKQVETLNTKLDEARRTYDTPFQQVACQNDKLKTLRKDKKALECENVQLIDFNCTITKDYRTLKETLACTEQKLQETKSTLERETCLREGLNEAYEQLKDEFACVKANLEKTDRFMTFTEEKLRNTSAKLDKVNGKNKRLSEQNDRLETDYTCLVVKCDEMAATKQKLNDTVSTLRYEICTKGKFVEENDRLKRESACLDKKLNDAEQRLQTTVSRLHEEICTKEKINEELIKLKEEYSCFCKDSENTTRQLDITERTQRITLYQHSIASNLNEESCKSKHLNEQNDRLCHMCVTLNEKLEDMADKLSHTKQTLQDTVFKLNEVTSEKNIITEKFDAQSTRNVFYDQNLNITKRKLQDAGSELNENFFKETKLIEEHNELENKYACVVEKLKTTKENLADAVSCLNEEMCFKHKIFEQHDKLRQELKCANGNLVDTKRKLYNASVTLAQEICAKIAIHEKYTILHGRLYNSITSL